MIARLGTRITNKENETFLHETVSQEFRTGLLQARMTKKKRQGCQECWCGERSSASR